MLTIGYKIKIMHKDAFVRTTAMKDKHVCEQGHFKSKNICCIRIMGLQETFKFSFFFFFLQVFNILQVLQAHFFMLENTEKGKINYQRGHNYCQYFVVLLSLFPMHWVVLFCFLFITVIMLMFPLKSLKNHFDF